MGGYKIMGVNKDSQKPCITEVVYVSFQRPWVAGLGRVIPFIVRSVDCEGKVHYSVEAL